MENVFLKLLNMSFTSCFIILGVLLLRPILKKAPKWITFSLWGFISLKLVCPISFESVWSLIPSKEPIPMDIALSPTPSLNTGFEIINDTVNPIFDSLTPQTANSVNPMQIILFVATIVWLMGIVVMCIYSLVNYLKLRKRVKAAILTEKNIYICDNIENAFILGIFKAKIYIPSSINLKESEYVVLHEKAHIKHLDHILKPFGFLILTLHWFNPLIWIAYILFCKDIELACDERVIKAMSSGAKKEYSKTLLTLSLPTTNFLANPLAFGEVSIKSRIKSILSYKKPTLWIIIAAVILSIILCIFFLTDPKPGAKNPIISEPDSASDSSSNTNSQNGENKNPTFCEGVTMELSEINLLNDPPTLTVTITNTTGKNVSYGEQFELYRTENGKKIDCFKGSEKYWHEILNILNGESGTHTVSIKDYDISKAGVYCFEFKYTVGDEEFDKYTALLEFAVDYDEQTTAEVFKTHAIAYDPTAFLGRFVAPPTVPQKTIIKIENGKLYINSESLGTGTVDSKTSAEEIMSSLYSSINNEVSWVEIGKLTETSLTKENFYDYLSPQCWLVKDSNSHSKYSPSDFKNSVKKAWQVKGDKLNYRLAQYGNNKYFLTYEAVVENKAYIHYLFLLEKV